MISQYSAQSSSLEVANEDELPITAPFSWPPPPTEHELRGTPTASPLYIPPPGTQHVKPKSQNSIQNADVSNVIDQVPASWLTQESRSAPQLTAINLKEHNELNESCSESYTSTCTTTTTTSEEYQRMYNAQPVLSQSYYYNDQSSTDMNSIYDYEVSSIQQTHGSFSSASTELLSFSGRRSAQDCSETLYNTMSTCQLVDYIRSVTPNPTESFPSIPKLHKKVEFVDDVKANIIEQNTIQSTELPTEQSAEGIDVKALNVEPIPPVIAVREVNITSKKVYEQDESLKCSQSKSISLAANKIDYPVPKEWISPMVRALTTASPKPFHIYDLPEPPADFSDFVIETNSKYSDTFAEITSASIPNENKEAEIKEIEPSNNEKPPEQVTVEVKKPPIKASTPTYHSIALPIAIPLTKTTAENIPMPVESEPYIPPPISMTPLQRPEPRNLRSPFIEALTVAPLRPFTPFENDIITQFDGLNVSKDIKLSEALTTAPAEPVNKLNADLPDETGAECTARLERERLDKQSNEVRQLIKKTVDSQLSKKCSAFATFKGFRSVDPFKPMPSPSPLFKIRSRSTSVANNSIDDQSHSCCTENSCQRKNSNDHQSDCISLCNHSNAQNHSTPTKRTPAFPPPVGAVARTYAQSGLHSPKAIPKYQRQWFNLSSQSPIRTPEPTELKENVPLAFIEVPHERSDSVTKPFAVTISATSSTTTEAISSSKSIESKQQTIVSTLSQSEAKSSLNTSAKRAVPITMTFQTIDPNQLNRPTTPSLINKPAPMIPYYQQNLTCEYYKPTSSHLFDPHARTPSPRPDCVRSPAPGPPPNPLNIQAPKLKTPDAVDFTPTLNLPSIVTGNSSQALLNAVNSAKLISDVKQGVQSSSQSFQKLPETVCGEQYADLNVQTRTSGSQANQAKTSDVESSQTFQIGNVQVQRNRRVVEEFEHSQKAQTIEIKSSNGQQQISSSINQPEIPYGRSYVAKLTRRLSETPITGRNIVAYHFPQTISPITTSGFPIKTPPPYPESVPADLSSKQIFPPPLATIINQSKPQQSINTQIKPSVPIPKPAQNLAFSGLSIAKQNQSNSSSSIGFKPFSNNNNSVVSDLSPASAGPSSKPTSNVSAVTAPKRGQGVLNASVGPGARVPQCGSCFTQIR